MDRCHLAEGDKVKKKYIFTGIKKNVFKVHAHYSGEGTVHLESEDMQLKVPSRVSDCSIR